MARSGAGLHPLAVGPRSRGPQGPRRAGISLGVFLVSGLQASCRPPCVRRGRQAGPTDCGPFRGSRGRLRGG
eukprot:2875171-Alexandrium_andersonii.AAC.1